MEIVEQNNAADFFSRLDIFLASRKLNDNKVTNACNISNGLIGKARKRGSLSQENISKILETYKDLNANWLLTGRGKMLLVFVDPTVRMIPLVKIDQFVAFQKTIYIEDQPRNKFVPSILTAADFLIEVNSITSSQKYANGDFLACKKLDLKDVFMQWNNVFLLDTKFGIWIKKIVKGKDEHHLLILGDNSSHDPFEIRMSEVNAMALVVGVVKVD